MVMSDSTEPKLPPDLEHLLERAAHLPLEQRWPLIEELANELRACAAYLPLQILQAQLEHPEPGRVQGSFWQGSLLCADLSGFTSFCEELSILGRQGAEEVSTVVNELFNSLVDEVAKYRGELLKFGGDALTAFFDAKTLGTMHASAATMAALSMQAHVKEHFSAIETRAGTFRLRLRVGVHSGKVFAAEVGDTSHIELVVTGPEVNQVARAQRMAAPGEVVVSEQTAHLLLKAQMQRLERGFYRVSSLPPIALTPPQPEQLERYFVLPQRGDIASLRLLAHQVAALRPYLIRGLPRRYLEATTEIGEFRPVSVLFANFFDFSAVLTMTQNNASVATAVLNTYFQRVQRVVHNYGGVINKVDTHTRGDKLMILFGAPGVHEDDPLRAVHCAFELNAVLKEANAEISELLRALHLERENGKTTREDGTMWSNPVPKDSEGLLRQCIGINTDTVFAGRVGGAKRYEYTVMGPAVNRSARLMEVAEENAVFLSSSTRNAVQRHVATVEEHPFHLKGIATPIIPYRALEGDYIPPVQARTALRRAPLVGREAERAFLVRQAREALRGRGRILVVYGEVGIGKTRLIEDVVQELVMLSVAEDPTHAVPQFQICTSSGQSFRQHFPYATLRPILQQLLGLTRTPRARQVGQPSHTVEQEVMNRVAKLAPELSHFAPLLADVLDISIAETALTRSLSPEQRRSRLQELLTKVIVSAAEGEAMLLLVEDVQWADYVSVEVLLSMGEAIADAPICMLLLSRVPLARESEETKSALCNTHALTLNALTPEHGVELLRGMLNSPPPKEMLPLLERSGGNPFFIEEMVRALVASGALVSNQQGEWRLMRPPDQVSIPSSIEGLVMELLDRLDEAALELVQLASVIGYRFSRQILEHLLPNPSKVRELIQRLIELGIFAVDGHEQNSDGEPSFYVFRHAMLRDVAYEGILFAQRRELHRRVAQKIESLGPFEMHLAELTRHYTLAEEWERAFQYNLIAGIEAQHRYANQEAQELFTTALQMVPHLLGQEKTTRLGNSTRTRKLTATLTPPSCPLTPLRIQILELYERMGDLALLMGQYEQSELYYLEGLDQAIALRKAYGAYKAAYRQEELELHDSSVLMAQLRQRSVRLHRLIAQNYEKRADYETAFSWVIRGMVNATTDNRDELARYYLLGASLYKHQGNYEQSLDWARLGLMVAEELGDLQDQAHAYMLLGNLWRDRGELMESISALERARTLLDQIKDARRLGEVLKDLGDVYQSSGRWRDAVKCYHQSLQISENIGDIATMAHASNSLAMVMVQRGELQLASDLYQYSSGQFQRIGSLLGLALVCCNSGEVLLLQGRTREAQHLIRTSISSLERLHARIHLPRALRLAAETALAFANFEQAEEYCAYALSIAEEFGLLAEEGIISRVMGQIALEMEDLQLAENHFARSRALLGPLQNLYELGKVAYWQARLAYLQGHEALVDAMLREAEQAFKKLMARHDLEVVKTFAKGIARSPR